VSRVQGLGLPGSTVCSLSRVQVSFNVHSGIIQFVTKVISYLSVENPIAFSHIAQVLSSILCLTVQGPSALPHRPFCVCDDKSLDSLRLHIALIVLYLLFTCPRSSMTCLQGVFATSLRRSSAAVTMSDSDVVYAMLQSLGELTYSVYQASLLPLLTSYNSSFRRLLVNSSSSCCRRCCSRRHTAQINDNIPPALTTVTTTHGNVRKSVKFDMEAVEFEIHY